MPDLVPFVDEILLALVTLLLGALRKKRSGPDQGVTAGRCGSAASTARGFPAVGIYLSGHLPAGALPN